MSEVLDKELITVPVIPPSDELSVFTSKEAIDPFLKRIRAELDKFVPNLTTVKGRKEIASIARDVAKVKVGLEVIGKRLADDQKEIPKKLDATRKHYKDLLDSWRDEVRKPLTDWEAAEDQRIEFHKSMLAHIEGVGMGLIGGHPQPFGLLFRELEEKIVIDEKFEEFEAEAHRMKAVALAKLKVAFEVHQKREAEQAELAKLRAEAVERAQKERDEAIARAAEAKALAKAEADAKGERDRVDAAAKAEKAAAEKRELELKLQAEAAELRTVEVKQEALREAERVARESAQKSLAEAAAKQAREANTKHRGAINRSALTALVEGGIPEDMAKKVITLIAAKSIPAVSISY
jgi:hypothetical protein